MRFVSLLAPLEMPTKSRPKLFKFLSLTGLVLAIFFPAFAHAAPALTTYTVSQGTIYPTATTASGLATTTTIDIKFSEQVKASIKIISANGTKVRLLYPSSGSSSSPVMDPTPKIWDGTNTAGTTVGNGTYTILISATSTATSLTMTDSSKTIVVASSDSTPPDTPEDSTETTTTTLVSGAPPEYIPIPTLRIVTNGDKTVSSGADTPFTVVVYDSKGNKRNEALVRWSFGDGMQRTGASVYHTYYYSGEYIAVVRVSTPDGGDASEEMVITVEDASIKITSVSARGISLANDSSRTLDLSLWRLRMGGKEFKIPADTQILSGRTTLFPSQIIELPLASSASLLYPSGEVVATYPTAPVEPALSADRQPSAQTVSFNKVQEVEPPAVISKATNIQTYDEAVIAPTAPTDAVAAVGAAPKKAGGLFSSPWFYSLLGVMALAGAAFIFI